MVQSFLYMHRNRSNVLFKIFSAASHILAANNLMEDQRLSTVVQSQFCINLNQEAMSHSGYSVPCLAHLLQNLIGDQRPYQSKCYVPRRVCGTFPRRLTDRWIKVDF